MGICSLTTFSHFARAQDSTQLSQSKHRPQRGLPAESYYELNHAAHNVPSRQVNTCELNKVVFGWHPYWQNGYEINYEWDLISDFCYFSYEVNAANGNAATTNSFATIASVTTALNQGKRVHLAVTLFENHSTFLGNTTSKQTLINNLITLVQNRGAHGVNIDFEGVPSSLKNSLTAFMNDLGTQMHNAIPSSIVSIDLPAVEWTSTFDVAAMTQVDWFMIMGYDYYYAGSSNAGPHSPLFTFDNGYDYNLSKSVSYYLNKGIAPENLILGVPYYGREWSTSSTTPGASTTGSSSSVFYNEMRNNADGFFTNRQWNDQSKTPYFVFNDGGTHQCFIDDEHSLKYRYDLVHRQKLAGIGIWALGYDDGYTELWQAIADHLTDCQIDSCSGTLTDMGGAYHNYYNNENYSYTIAPPGAAGVTLSFTEFSIQNGIDSLWLYDGFDAQSSLLGSYTGSALPADVTAFSGGLTLRFKSDAATTASGFKANWQCLYDTQAPTCQITSSHNWETENFDMTFDDSDNSGIDKAYYQVLETQNGDTVAHVQNGFMHQNFDQNFNNWTLPLGTWQLSGQSLQQTEAVNSNTNIYTELTQDPDHSYLYEWDMAISGSGSNRRAGLYVFSDNAASAERGNAYMVYFRTDQSKCQIYKVVNNNLQIKSDDTCTVALDVMYHYALTYHPSTGYLKVYQNGRLVSQWLDDEPIQNGAYVSLRTGDCTPLYDNINVYKSRSNLVEISVGASADKDIQIDNFDPFHPAALIRTQNQDVFGLFSQTDQLPINVDTSVPEIQEWINDGLLSDFDTTFESNPYRVSWSSATDPNSEIQGYWLAIGHATDTTAFYPWTDMDVILSGVINIDMIPESLYYVYVRSENGAGLFSEVLRSDGIIYRDTTLGIPYLNNRHMWSVGPNPVLKGEKLLVNTSNNLNQTNNWQMFNSQGVLVAKGILSGSGNYIPTDELSQGIYILIIDNEWFKVLIE